ncbi:hypothetical protein M3I53_21010 [Paraburkholderia sp. CNPSo 3272]|uniref:hypothetical protein n=1 Tax=Paraburkholderia sp. CNPSo 3272 TaxID=2940931 RepID=UPI0020B8BF54|nr:hypothetical protein [Paraburkholderia sp. CNPSo 3272]MCP3725575.1 hypothetical protein [Paraburkholderia sp. CNPSo 3272]
MEDESGTRPAQSPEGDRRNTAPPEHTRQEKRDESEKSKHEASENELPSTQEKNPIPPGTTQKTS